MDIFNIISINIVFLPLIFGLFLLFCRIRLVLVNKKLLDYGLFVINLLNFVLCSILAIFVYFKKLTLDFGYKISDFLNIELIYGINVDKRNIFILFFAALFYFLISCYLVRFFKTKKQFLFTKQRYYILLSFLIFVTYSFICSNNLLLSMIFGAVGTFILFVFAYFDIFKTGANYNIIRFLRLNFISDFCFFAAFLVFFRYAVFLKNSIQTTAINYSDLNLFLLNLMPKTNSPFEYKIAIISILIAVFTRLSIFPFNCYYSFLANSSRAFYLPVIICANNFIGVMLYLNIIQVFNFFPKINFAIYVFAILSVLYSAISLLFEKNIKIVFGYLISILNSLFIVGILFFEKTIYVYFCCLSILLVILFKLFSMDKVNFKRRLINKNKGFYLEKLHIIFFETFPIKIANLFLFLNKNVLGLIFKMLYKILNLLVGILAIRHIKASRFNIIRNIFLVFALFIILTIIIILFGGADFG